MAKSGTITGSKPSGLSTIWLTIEWSATQDIVANTSKITANVYWHKASWQGVDGRSDNTYRYGTSSSSYTEKSWYQGAISGGTKVKLKSFSFTVKHDAKGDAKAYLYARYRLFTTYGGIDTGALTASATVTLDRIGRASTIARSDFNDWTYNLEMKRMDSSFWHKATISGLGTYVFGSKLTVNRTMSEWLQDTTTAMSRTYPVSIQTYADEACKTPLGDPVTTSFTVNVPSDAAPVIDESKVHVASTVPTYGYLQTYTGANVTADEGFYTLKYGATIVNSYVTMEGKFSGIGGNTANFAGYGDIPITVTVVDSRGLSASITKTVNVTQYTVPSLRDVTIFRCLEDGTKDEDAGEHISIRCSFGTVIPVLLDRCEAVINEARTVALESGTTSVIDNIAKTRSYDVVVTVYDLVGNNASFRTTVPTVYATFNAMNGGRGAAFGKMSETAELLDVAWDIRTEGKLIVNDTEMTEDDLIEFKSYGSSIEGLHDEMSVQNDLTSGLIYAYGFEPYPENTPRVTRVGNIVYLEGMIRTTNTSASTSNNIIVASLPEWARPRVRVNLLMQGSQSNIFWLSVYPPGATSNDTTVRVGRYRPTNSTDSTTIPSGAQIPITASWIAADAYPD